MLWRSFIYRYKRLSFTNAFNQKYILFIFFVNFVYHLKKSTSILNMAADFFYS